MNTLYKHFWKLKPLRLFLLSVSVSLSGGCQSSFYYNCHEGGAIDAKKKLEISKVSLQFVQAAFAGDVDSAYNHFTEAAKANTSIDQLRSAVQFFNRAGPFEELRIERILTVTGWGDSSKSNGVAICSKDTAHPEAGVTVAIQKIQEQAYALVSAKSQANNETWITALWLVSRAGKWQVHAFHATMATALGKSVEEYLAMARSEKNRGHALNAGLLYSDAASIAARGRFYHTGIEDVIQREAQQVTPPQELSGSAPFRLSGDGGSYSILRLSTMPLSRKLYLVIAHEVDPWKDSKEIEQRNKNLISTFAKRFPEYAYVFGGVVAEARVRGGNNGWRTVQENAAIHSSLATRE